MSRNTTRPSFKELRESAGFPEAVASLLTVLIFIVSYWFESHGVYSDLLFRGIFLLGACVLCGMIIYGVCVRHFIPGVSHIITAGAILVGLSQLTGFLEVMPALRHMPVIGPEGRGYITHLDDMMLYPGFVLMLCGFYVSILHANRMQRLILHEVKEKEAALDLSNRTAEILARRVAFENLATGISTRFINVGHQDIDPEIVRALELVGRFTDVDRASFVVARASLLGKSERFEWCGEGVASLSTSLQGTTAEDFAWSLGALDRGESILVPGPRPFPPEAAFEQTWIERSHIRSLARVPILSNGRLRGYIGLENEREALNWPDETIPLLRMIGEILLTAWDRRCVLRQRAMLELQVQQAQKMESLGVMAGGIAHDFNNILTGIMGNAELVQLGLPENDDLHRYIDGITQSSRRAAELCRQMLAYAGRGKFVSEQFQLNDLVREMMPLLRASVTRLASFESELSESLPVIEGDTSQFRQILVNLVTNASESLGDDRAGAVLIRTGLRYCTTEMFRATLLPEALPPGDYVFLEITDNGSGIPPEMVEKIFEPFFTTRFAGRGLGLSAVLGIVRSHRGALQLESTVGKGTRITLYFPALDTATRTYVANGELLGDWHGHGTVLLADDEEMVLSVGTMMLNHFGLDVVAASDAKEALDRAIACADHLQCVILDMSMPHMNGDATCAEFARRFPGVPIVISSGYSREEVDTHFAPGRVAAFLPKPFELSHIQATMRELLEPARPG